MHLQAFLKKKTFINQKGWRGGGVKAESKGGRDGIWIGEWGISRLGIIMLFDIGSSWIPVSCHYP